jgi:TRAP-type C4-dicarboxylate transport system permease large subunit
MEKIFKGSMPFLYALIAAAIILTAFPRIATFLPDLLK